MLATRALRDPWKVAVLAATLAGGVTLTVFAEHFGPLAAFSVLIAVPLLVLGGPKALGQGREFVRTLRRHLAWWHWLWFLLLLSSLNFRPRTSQDIEASPVDSWALFRIALVGCVAFILGARLAFRKTAWLRSLFRGLLGALSAYALVCIVSTVWSAYPAWTLYRSCEYWVDVALLAAILASVKSTENYRTLFDWTLTLYLLLVSCAWLGVAIWPKVALNPVPGLIGVELESVLPAMPANSVGELAAILTIVAFVRLFLACSFRSQRLLYLLLLLMSLATLFLSQARSAILGLGAGIALLLLYGRRLAALGIVVLAPLPLFFSGVRDWLHEYFMRGQSSEMFASLSGRVDWWQSAWQEFLRSPLTGLGAYTSRFEVLAKLGDSETSSIHNTYLEVLFGTSLWGLIPVVVTLLATWWILLQSLRRYARDSPERLLTLEAVAVLAVVSVRSMFTSHLVSHPSLSFLLAVGYAELLRRGRWKPQQYPNPTTSVSNV